MATKKTGIERQYDDLIKKIDARGIVLFPARIEPDGHEAEWPDDNVDRFLDAACTLGVRVVYAQADWFEPEDMLRCFGDALGVDEDECDECCDEEDEADTIDNFLEVASRNPAFGKFMKKVEGHLGDMMGFGLDFVHDGVVHHFDRTAPWFDALVEETCRLVESVLDEIRKDEEDDEEDQPN